MARYNRDFLVPYLEDICALHLSKQKVQRMIGLLERKISRINQDALNKVEKPQYEKYKESPNGGDLAIGCLGMICCLGGLACIFLGPLFGGAETILYAALLAIPGCYCVFRSIFFYDGVNKEIKKRNDKIKEEHELGEFAALVSVEPQVKSVQKNISTLKGEIQNIDALLTKHYSVNVIPGWYRDIYAAVYLYDWFSRSQADDLDMALNTLVLEQIKDRLDTIIRNQGEMIINQRIMIANQQKSMEQAERHHVEQMAKLNRIAASNEDRNMYLSMIEANTAANAYFAAANYLK